MQLLDLLYRFRVVLDFVLCRRLIRPNSALYPVSVRQFRSLRPASFSHYLTIATLLFANSSYYHACNGLSPSSYHPCRAHNEKSYPQWITFLILFSHRKRWAILFIFCNIQIMLITVLTMMNH
jgi:hypothetical protein